MPLYQNRNPLVANAPENVHGIASLPVGISGSGEKFTRYYYRSRDKSGQIRKLCRKSPAEATDGSHELQARTEI